MDRVKLKVVRADEKHWSVADANKKNWCELGQKIFATFATRAEARKWLCEHREEFELDA
jgi:hypothetical protein